MSFPYLRLLKPSNIVSTQAGKAGEASLPGLSANNQPVPGVTAKFHA